MGITKWNPLERTSFSFKPFHNCYLYVTAERQNNISFFPWTALQKCTCLATGTTSRGKRAILHDYQQLKVTLSEKFLLTDFCFNIQFWDVISLSHVYFFFTFSSSLLLFYKIDIGLPDSQVLALLHSYSWNQSQGESHYYWPFKTK